VMLNCVFFLLLKYVMVIGCDGVKLLVCIVCMVKSDDMIFNGLLKVLFFGMEFRWLLMMIFGFCWLGFFY